MYRSTLKKYDSSFVSEWAGKYWFLSVGCPKKNVSMIVIAAWSNRWQLENSKFQLTKSMNYDDSENFVLFNIAYPQQPLMLEPGGEIQFSSKEHKIQAFKISVFMKFLCIMKIFASIVHIFSYMLTLSPNHSNIFGCV